MNYIDANAFIIISAPIFYRYTYIARFDLSSTNYRWWPASSLTFLPPICCPFTNNTIKTKQNSSFTKDILKHVIQDTVAFSLMVFRGFPLFSALYILFTAKKVKGRMTIPRQSLDN